MLQTKLYLIVLHASIVNFVTNGQTPDTVFALMNSKPSAIKGKQSESDIDIDSEILDH